LKAKVKVKLYPVINKHHARKPYVGNGGTAPRILNLGRGKRPQVQTGYEAGWTPEPVVDAVASRKIPSLPLPGTEPRSSSPQPSH